MFIFFFELDIFSINTHFLSAYFKNTDSKIGETYPTPFLMSSPNLPDFCLCSPLALRPVFLPHPPTLDTQTAQTSGQSLDPQVFNNNQFLNLLWLSLLIRQRKTSDTSPCHVCVFMMQNLPEQVTVCWNNDHVGSRVTKWPSLHPMSPW